MFLTCEPLQVYFVIKGVHRELLLVQDQFIFGFGLFMGYVDKKKNILYDKAKMITCF